MERCIKEFKTLSFEFNIHLTRSPGVDDVKSIQEVIDQIHLRAYPVTLALILREGEFYKYYYPKNKPSKEIPQNVTYDFEEKDYECEF